MNEEKGLLLTLSTSSIDTSVDADVNVRTLREMGNLIEQFGDELATGRLIPSSNEFRIVFLSEVDGWDWRLNMRVYQL